MSLCLGPNRTFRLMGVHPSAPCPALSLPACTIALSISAYTVALSISAYTIDLSISAYTIALSISAYTIALSISAYTIALSVSSILYLGLSACLSPPESYPHLVSPVACGPR